MIIAAFQNVEPPAPLKGGSDFFKFNYSIYNIIIQDYKKNRELIMDFYLKPFLRGLGFNVCMLLSKISF